MVSIGEGICLSSVTTAKIDIGVIRDSGLLTEWLGKALGTLAIFYAGSIGLLRTVGSVDHVLYHQCMQLRMSVRIRNLSREKLVEFIRSLKLEVRMEKDDEMGVRKATLLKLIGVAVFNGFSQTSCFHDVLEQLLTLHVKDSADDVWMISRLLARKEG